MDPNSIDRIYWDAAQIDAPADRDAYLERACGGDERLRLKVEQLLAVRSQAEPFLESPPPAPDVTVDEPPAADGAGTTIGPYKLLQQIGEGGMGTVFMAEQTEPVRRKVALKVIKPGMDSAQVVARFEAERQALALMDHVNIARVYDGGTTENGRPYFVMELVHGVPITKYCDDNHLTPRERLELFVPVCQAIQHAHQKGIIHRDIKPSNVLITLYDGQPAPKVIDFGVAKATEHELTERTLFTQYGTIVGTLEYMSPEQAEMSALGVDTRSDIYSLGVLLYELLTGSTPLTHKRMKESAYAEILRMIKEDEPPRPSARLSDSGAALASISAHRHMEPAKLTKLVRGELDWIVMKPLEKDRNRRYETAKDFAVDVQRYLNDEPVHACPPSAAYRLQKFLRKHRAGAAAAAAIGILLLAGVAGSSWQAVRATRAEARVRRERDEKEKARAEIEASAERLRQSMFLAAQAVEARQQHRWAAAYALCARCQELSPLLPGFPMYRSWICRDLRLYDLADQHATEVFGLTDRVPPWGPGDWFQYTLIRFHLGDEAGYRDYCGRMLRRFPDKVGEPDVVRACVLSPTPVVDPNELVRRAERMNARERAFWTVYIEGLALYRAGRYQQAVERLEESLTMDPTWVARAINYPPLAMAYFRLGNPDEARRSLALAEKAIDDWTDTIVRLPVDSTLPIPWYDWVECRLYYREATLLITGSPPADDPRLGLIRQRALAALGVAAEPAGKEPVPREKSQSPAQ
jgi:serine/threonine protein kinase